MRMLAVLLCFVAGGAWGQVISNPPGLNPSATNAVLPTARLNLGVGLPVSVTDFQAKHNALTFSDGTITAGTNAFCSNSATFSSADVGKTIQIDGAAGTTSAPLNTTIASFVSTHCVTLAANATATTPLSYFASATVTTGGATGSYIPGETVTLTGGTQTTQAVANIQDTLVHSAAIVAGGTGGVNGTCVVQGTTGNGTLFQISTTISGNAITALGSITVAGHYFTNPTSLSAEPITNINNGSCAPTGATLSLVMWAETVNVNTAGSYSVTPANSAATGAGSSSGATGLTLSLGWNATGSYVYGNDDSAAFVSAINQAAAEYAAGSPAYVFAPAGAYLIDVNALPTMGSGLGIVGEGVGKTFFIVGASYSGDLFSWSDAWLGNSVPFNGAMGQVTDNTYAARAVGFSVYGNRRSPAQQSALSFYDHDDEVLIDDVEVKYLNGRCLYAGAQKNDNASYMRESRLGRIRCFNDGKSGVPVVEFTSTGSGDTTNEVYISELDIYAPYSTGLWIHNGASNPGTAVTIQKLRIEGLEGNAANVSGDLLEIGDPSNNGIVSGFSVGQLGLVDPYPGYAALHITGTNSANAPYFIRIGADYGAANAIGGGVPLGYGVKIDVGRSLYLHMAQIYTWETGFTTGASSGSPIVLDMDQNESTVTYSIAGSPTAVYTPLRASGQLGNPTGTASLNLQNQNSSAASSPAQSIGVQDGVGPTALVMSVTHSAFPIAKLQATGAGGGFILQPGNGGMYFNSISTSGTPYNSLCQNSASLVYQQVGSNCFGVTGAPQTIAFMPGAQVAVSSVPGGFAKVIKTSTVDSFIVTALALSCATAPTVTMYECGTSTTCASPTTIASVQVTAAGTATPATISSSAITAGDYVAFEETGGVCAGGLNVSAQASVHAN